MTDFDLDLPLIHAGKVRRLYALPGDDQHMLMVATDTISAHDHILSPAIPDKGAILNQLSLWWFDQLKHVVGTHITSTVVPEEVAGRAVVCERLDMIPVECVARGYLAGSAWTEYQEQGTVAGVAMPQGLQMGSRLPEPIFTPATKAEQGEHDENITFEELTQRIGVRPANHLRELTLALYTAAEEIARQRGLILADTKFEFGRNAAGMLVLADEVLTPDSSRYWDAQAWAPGTPMESFDKQPVRDWLTHASGWDGTSTPPVLPADVVEATRARYVAAYERLTGINFVADGEQAQAVPTSSVPESHTTQELPTLAEMETGDTAEIPAVDVLTEDRQPVMAGASGPLDVAAVAAAATGAAIVGGAAIALPTMHAMGEPREPALEDDDDTAEIPVITDEVAAPEEPHAVQSQAPVPEENLAPAPEVADEEPVRADVVPGEDAPIHEQFARPATFDTPLSAPVGDDNVVEELQEAADFEVISSVAPGEQTEFARPADGVESSFDPTDEGDVVDEAVPAVSAEDSSGVVLAAAGAVAGGAVAMAVAKGEDHASDAADRSVAAEKPSMEPAAEVDEVSVTEAVAKDAPKNRYDSGMARVIVDVMPKPEILDPQGKAVSSALSRLGFEGLTVRQGKRFEIDVEGELTDDRLHEIEHAANTLLANTVIEDYVVRVEQS